MSKKAIDRVRFITKMAALLKGVLAQHSLFGDYNAVLKFSGSGFIDTPRYLPFGEHGWDEVVSET